jgi:hypothetical protein
MKMKNILSSIFATRYENQFLVRNEFMRWSLLILLFAAAFGIRVVGVTQIPLNYHPIKQYRAAITAKAFYYSYFANVPEAEKEVAVAALDRIGILGPPVASFLGAVSYWINGAEALWIPKMLSTIYWMIGGIFLYATARRMMKEDAALLSTSIYLLLPFGVISSQSFQPDPLMMMLMIISIYLVVAHHERQTRFSLISMSLLASAAILIKPVSLFIIYGAFFALQVHRHGLNRRLIFNKENFIFFAISLFPSFLYYSYGIFNTSNLNEQAQKSFVPQLFLQFDFWDGWLKRVRLAVGFTMFLGGMIGTLLYPAGWQKKMLFGMWAGYFAMCLAFSYTISTHDYYHLPLFPIIGLAFGSIAGVLMQNLRQQVNNQYFEIGTWAILLVALFLGAGTNVQSLRKLPDYQPEIRLAEDIGRAVSNSTKTIMLSPYDAKPLIYYGKIAGEYWPYWFDIRDEKLWGVTNLTPEDRLRMLTRGTEPEYFIIADLEEYENQSDLKQFLESTYPVVIEDPRFLVYDLKASR